MRKKFRPVSAGLFVIALLAVVPPAEGASGQWESAWGKDVDAVAPSTGPEICVIAANCKIAATDTGLGGEFGGQTTAATDADGNVYVTDFTDNRVQKFDSNGNFLRLWGKDVTSAGPNQTGTGFEICVAAQGDTCKAGVQGTLGGEMRGPDGIAVGSDGLIYVADSSNSRIQRFSPSGVFSLAWGKDVTSAGPDDLGTGFEICDPGLDTCKTGVAGGLGGELSDPDGLAFSGSGTLYVAEAPTSDRIQAFDFNGSGIPHFTRLWGKDVVTGGGTGAEICTAAANCKAAAVGTTLAGEFNDPVNVAVDAAGDVYAADIGFHRVQKFDSTGNFLRLWGEDVVSAGPGNTGTGAEICIAAQGDTCKSGIPTTGLAGELRQPGGLAVDAGGAIYVSEFSAHRISVFDSGGHFQRAWGQNVVSAGPGNTGTGLEICLPLVDTCQNGTNGSPSLGGQMINPTGLATGPAGELYVVDQANRRMQKFAADPPPETTIAAGPSTFGTATPSFTLTSSDAGSTFECSVDGGAFAICLSPLTTTALADGAHQLQVRATDPARQVDGTPDARAFTIDTAASDTQIDSGPAAGAIIDDSTPTFGFSANEAGSTFECRLDAEAFSACSGPGAGHTTAELADGGHTFEVRATDPVGNVDASPAAREFTVDTPDLPPPVLGDKTAPETTIAKAPKRKSAKRKAKFSFTSNEPGSTFECKLDKGGFAPCAAQAKFKVKPGKHTLEVQAIDAAGNVDPTPAKAKWKVKR